MLPSYLSLVRSSLNAKREQKFDDKSPINYDHNSGVVNMSNLLVITTVEL